MSSLLRVWWGAWLCAFCLTLGSGARAEEARELRRFALLVSANDGGPKRPLLKHAEHDAQAMASVLRELGGVREADLVLLTQPTKAALEDALAAMARRFSAATASGARSELVFYYSGHSDEYGLLLAGVELSYAALRARLQSLPADVRVAILDSCASGAFTREKGGKLRPPFMLDASTDVRGHAFLTSASGDEAAQESDSVGGSFFTHFLVSGLRGAADSSGDGKVTLTEAYRYAFDETLVHTGRTHYGAQHPAYDMRLVGTGDLVLTDLRSMSAELRLASELEGRLLLREPGGRLLLEVLKRRGKEAVLGVPVGAYVADLSRDGKFFQASIITHVKGTTLLAESAFQEVKGHPTRARGTPYRVVPAAAALVERVSTNRYAGTNDVLNHLNVSLVYDRPAALRGVQLSLGATLVRDEARGVQLAPLVAASSELMGLQVAGVVGYVRQAAAGVMLGGLATISTGHARGMLVAPFVWAKELSGVQIGAVNTAGNVRGVQLGFINVAAGEVRGLSVGLFNYARKADVSLAPIALTKHGGAHFQYEVTDTGFLSFSLRLDATYNYSFVSVRAQPAGERRGYAVGAGLGAKVPLWRESLFTDVDLSFHVLQPERDWYRGVPNFLGQLRALVRYQVHSHFSVFAGPALSLMVQTDPARRADVGFMLRRHTLTEKGADVRVAIWPGFAAGLRF